MDSWWCSQRCKNILSTNVQSETLAFPFTGSQPECPNPSRRPQQCECLFSQTISCPVYYHPPSSHCNAWPELQTTFDTFVHSFTQQLHVSETIPGPANTFYSTATATPTPGLYFDGCSTNIFPTMANYRAITKFYNARRIDFNTILQPQVNREITPTSFLSIPQVPAATHRLSTQEQLFDTTSFAKAAQYLEKNTNWKYLSPQLQKQSIISTMADLVQRQDKQKLIKSLDQLSEMYSTEECTNQPNKSPSYWDNVTSTTNYVTNMLRNISSRPQMGTISPEPNSEKNESKNMRHLLIKDSLYGNKIPFDYASENKWIMRYLDRYYDYVNPYGCDFCEISSRFTNNILELSEQKLLLHFLTLNPHELGDGIKVILNWPLDKLSNNILAETDGIAGFYDDDRKRNKEEPVSDSTKDIKNRNSDNSQRQCFIKGCLCRVNTLVIDQMTQNEQKHNFVYEQIVQMSEANYQSYQWRPNVASEAHSEEIVRNRMAEFVCIGPLNNNWYMELLEGFWSRDRPRMTYTENFVYPHNGDGDKNMYYPCEPISQEKLQEIMMRRAQLKPRNRM